MLQIQIKDYLKTFFRPHNLLSIPKVVEKPPGTNVLVLSPHFDDDVLGCGGTLYKHVLAGDKVTVVYLTDGREGDPDVHDKAVVEKIRKEEAKRATALLGITNLVFLDQPETRLKVTAALIEELTKILAVSKPTLIYLPSFLENHVDHFEVNRIFLSVAPTIDFPCNVCAYEVWTPLLPNVVVDITEVLAKKKEAAEQYASQLKQVDYVGTILALNRYRSITVLKGQGYAEAFLCLPSDEYVSLLGLLDIEKRSFIDRKFLVPIRKLSNLFASK